MGKVTEIPIVKFYTRYECGTCKCKFFQIADAYGKLIAVCAECEAPTVPLDCSCTLHEENNV